MAREPLKVCPKCGWYAHGPHGSGRCDPARGSAADALIDAIGLPATKLGYGDYNIAIYFREPRSEEDIPSHIQLEVQPSGKFHIREVWCLEDFGQDAMAAIINALKDTPIAGGKR